MPLGDGAGFAPVAGVPRHVGLVPGGHRKWATARLQPDACALIQGLEALLDAVDVCLLQQIQQLTVFALNSDHAVDAFDDPGHHWIASLLRAGEATLQTLAAKNVRVRLVGQWGPLKPSLMRLLQEAQARTRHHGGLTLNLVPARPCSPEASPGAHFQATQPPPLSGDGWGQRRAGDADNRHPTEPDLLIRTGGSSGTQDAMVWDSSRTALFFTDLPWPDFRANAFESALQWYGFEGRAAGVLAGRAALGL